MCSTESRWQQAACGILSGLGAGAQALWLFTGEWDERAVHPELVCRWYWIDGSSLHAENQGYYSQGPPQPGGMGWGSSAEALHVGGNALSFCSLWPTAGEQLCWESPAVLLDRELSSPPRACVLTWVQPWGKSVPLLSTCGAALWYWWERAAVNISQMQEQVTLTGCRISVLQDTHRDEYPHRVLLRTANSNAPSLNGVLDDVNCCLLLWDFCYTPKK